MTAGSTPIRGIRIDDPRWDAAQAKAKAEGRSVSAAIRGLLDVWLDRTPPAGGLR